MCNMGKRIAIIGGGACGMAAAITAARSNADVTVYEGNDRVGKKILSTGNGKCNLGNLQLSADDYYSSNRELVEKCLKRFGTKETLAFFESLGLMVRERNGYLYPLSEQAASVLDVLRFGLERCGAGVRCESKVVDIVRDKTGFLVKTKDRAEHYDRIILACGSKAAPKTGSDGSGYRLAARLGVKVNPAVPALVQLTSDCEYLKALAGIRTDAVVTVFENGKPIASERGELQLTERGISGIPVFQLSGAVNRRMALCRNATYQAVIDFMPEASADQVAAMLSARIARLKDSNVTMEEFCAGMLNKKLMAVFLKMADIKPIQRLKELKASQFTVLQNCCKAFPVGISGSLSFENAQVCSGGVDMCQLTEELEAESVRGLYFAGELLDVDGRCGGYNLHWAWASGCIAGEAAAK